jgi:hypothetical protein
MIARAKEMMFVKSIEQDKQTIDEEQEILQDNKKYVTRYISNNTVKHLESRKI